MKFACPHCRKMVPLSVAAKAMGRIRSAKKAKSSARNVTKRWRMRCVKAKRGGARGD